MKCNEFGNSTDPDLFGIGNEFGGIPNNFITNFLGWLIFMLIFVLSRKSCIKVIVGTLGKNWARISGAFFNPEPPSEPISGQDAEAGVGEREEVYHSDNISNLSDPECSHVTDRLIRNRHEELARLKREEEEEGDVVDGVWSWVRRFRSVRSIHFSDDIMLKLAGPDSVQYLR